MQITTIITIASTFCQLVWEKYFIKGDVKKDNFSFDNKSSLKAC